MAHQFVYSTETGSDHVFVCSICGLEVGFNKPEFGTPSAVIRDDGILPPDDVEAYVTPCPGEQA